MCYIKVGGYFIFCFISSVGSGYSENYVEEMYVFGNMRRYNIKEGSVGVCLRKVGYVRIIKNEE